MKRLWFSFTTLCIALLLSGSPAHAADDSFAGNYRGDTIDVQLAATPTGYSGTIAMASSRFPLTATTSGNELRGTFTSGGDSFNFTLARDGNRFTLRTGTAVHVLQRVAGNAAAPDNRIPGAAPATQPKEDFIRLTRASVIDPMSNNQVALTMLVPSDWKTEGGVVWPWNAFYPTTLHMRVFNPKGAEETTYYPSLLFTDGVRESVWQSAIIAGPEVAQRAIAAWPDGSNYMGFEVRTRVKDPVAVLRDYALPRYRKDLVGLRPISVKELPEVAKAVAADYAGANGLEDKVVAIRFAYDLQGVAMEEEFQCTLMSVPTLPPMVSWGMEFQSFRAKKGELDDKMRMFQVIKRSAQLDMKWYAGMCSVQEMMKDGIRQNIENAGRLSKYIAQRSEEISQIIREGYESRQRSQDKIHDAFSQVIRGVERYKDPHSSHPMELPSGYDHAFMSPRGEIIMSNNPNFNPAAQFHEDWKELPKARG